MDGANKESGFIARILDKATSIKHDVFTPKNWFGRQKIIQNPPTDSGYAFIQNPYNSIFNVQWGIQPDADLAKYRLLYRNVPKVKRAIDKTVSSAINKGIRRFEYKEPVTGGKKYIKYLTEWVEKQDDWKITLMMIASDCLIFGNSFVEIVYDRGEEFDDNGELSPGFRDIDPYDSRNGIPEKVDIPNEFINYVGRGMYPVEDPMIEKKLVDSYGNKIHSIREYHRTTGEVLWLKVLDPLYMRVRADSYGNVFGYIQWLSNPPISFTTEKIAHFRYNPKSTAYEQCYGTSMLQSMIRTQEAIWQIENDALIIGHTATKPPIHFSIESQDGMVMPDEVFVKFQAQMKNRGAGGDIFTRGDVVANQLTPPSNQLAQIYTHLHYHDVQRSIALGVPPALLGEPEGSSRTTAEVSLDDWINTLQILQKEIANVLEEQVFKYVLEAKFGEGTPVPHIVWNELFNKNENDVVSRIVSLKGAGIITFNEARNMLQDLGYKMSELGEMGDVIPEIFQLEMEQEQMINEEMAAQESEEQGESTERKASVEGEGLDTPNTPEVDNKGNLMNPGIKRKSKRAKKGKVK
jgi:hypothetical protein